MINFGTHCTSTDLSEVPRSRRVHWTRRWLQFISTAQRRYRTLITICRTGKNCYDQLVKCSIQCTLIYWQMIFDSLKIPAFRVILHTSVANASLKRRGSGGSAACVQYCTFSLGKSPGRALHGATDTIPAVQSFGPLRTQYKVDCFYGDSLFSTVRIIKY